MSVTVRLPQVYRDVCWNVLVICRLCKSARFTCGGGWRAYHSESAFSGTFAAARLPQVYRAIYRNVLKHRWLQRLFRFTCEGRLRTERPEKYVWGTLATTKLPQVYRKTCSNVLKHKWLRRLFRFTCGGRWSWRRSGKRDSSPRTVGNLAACVAPLPPQGEWGQGGMGSLMRVSERVRDDGGYKSQKDHAFRHGLFIF